MKKLFILTLLVVYLIPCFGQDHEIVIQPNQEIKIAKVYDELTQQTLYEFTSYNYGYWAEQVQNDPPKNKWYNAHTALKFNLPSLPTGAYNISVKLEAFRGSYSAGDSRVVEVPDNLLFYDYDDIWYYAEIGNEYFVVDRSSGQLHDITSLYQSKIVQGYINFGIRQYQSGGYERGYVNMYMHIYYDLPVSVTAQNNFPGGKIYVDTAEKDAPWTFSKIVGETANLKAKEQNDNLGYPRIWNDIEAPNAKSRWEKNGSDVGSGIEKSFIVAQSDDGSIYEAGLRKNFKIDRFNQTEFDGNPTATSYIVEQNSGQISTTGNGYTPGTIPYNFVYWTDNLSNSITRTITPTDNSTFTALYKAAHKSNQTNAYSNTSQRRFVQTPDGVKHICYESMNKVWYELSTDNGATWILGNGGKPLSSTDAKNPSMSFYGNQLGIVWQEKNGGTFNIKLALFYSSNYSSSVFSTLVSSDDADYSYNANPVVEWGYNGKAAVVWSGFDMCENPFGGTALKYWYGDATSGGISQLSQCAIAGTDANSINPTITANYSVYSNPFYFHFAWQQVINSSTLKINYCKLYASGNNLANTTFEEASLNSGFSKNYNPVIVLKKFGTSEYIYVTWLGNRTSPTTETKVLLKYKLGTNWSTTGVYGTSPVQNFSINKGTTIINNQEPLALCWSEPNDSSFSNKLMKAPGSGILVLGTSGKDMQINNGTTFSSMFANSFSSASLPYSFSLSQNFGSINKENSMKIFNGREGVVGKNGAQFFFALGDISINGQNINFISVPDTVSVSSLPLLNAYFESEPFTVNSSSNLIYGVQYGITDSLLCSSALSENEQINFKVELLDALTNEVLGVYDEVTYNKQNVYQYNNMGYQVNLSGIGNRPVKFKLVTNTNAEFGYSLSNITADQNILAKGSYQTVNYKGNLAVTDYDLAQNFPNPFNPSTTISYQIPQDGIVTLKIYDVLGSEVATLVNEERIAGKYEVNFNASSLASGVYIYKIQAGSFINSKKMILLK
jgi:hypothetical protein